MHYKLHAKIYIYIMRKLVVYVPAYYLLNNSTSY